jgi:hypothetical protein
MGNKIKYKTMKPVKFILYFILFIAVIYACEQAYTDSGTAADASGAGKGGSMARFAISGDHLYTVTEQNLKLFDIANRGNPEYTDSINIGFGIETIFPRGENLFIGSQSGMYIYDISDPSNPEKLTRYEHVYSCDPVVVEGNYAYVTLNSENEWCGRFSNMLQIIDISDLTKPYLVKEYQMTCPHGLGVDNDLLFICDDGLKVYDVSNVYNIDLLNHFSQIDAYDVIPNDNLLIMIGSDGLYQYSYVNNSVSLLSTIPVN